MASLPTWLFPQLAPSSVFLPSPSPTNPDGATSTAVQTQGSGSSTTQGSSTLYLFTFLTTLLLLLAVSCGIIARSFVLRRRYRRRMAEAIAAGIMLPDGTFAGWDGHRHRHGTANLSEKPKMWEVTLSGGDRPKAVIDDWEGTQPMSASVKKPESADADNAGSRYSGRNASHQLFPFALAQLFARSAPRSTTVPAAPAPDPNVQAGVPETAPEDPPTAPNNPGPMSVSVIIAMPVATNPTFVSQDSKTATRQSLDDNTESTKGKSKAIGTKNPSVLQEEELPDIVIGVTDVGCTGSPSATAEHPVNV